MLYKTHVKTAITASKKSRK